MLDFVERLFNEHKLVRRLLLLWVVWFITKTIDQFFALPEHAEHTASVVIAVVGLLTIVIGLYQWDRARDKDDSE
jgi:uncharacterized membrane protein HdeD (DUF308 family)